MRKTLFLLGFLGCLGMLGVFGIGQVRATYDPLSVPNNKFGIHILEPDEIDKAKDFADSSGGEWGYVTIPIRANDRDLEKWTKFMQKAREDKLIPILRIASFPQGDHWMAPGEYDLLDFANFLGQLPWPTKNRYVIIYNEPNHESEWGGFVYPEEYAHVLGQAIDIFHQVNGDFFVIAAGLDASQPNILTYYSTIENTDPGLLSRVDGLSFHAYGNPGFDTPPNIYSRVNVRSFAYEENYLCRYFKACNRPVFLTETGWKNPADWYFVNAFTYAWTDQNIVAVTPFLLDGGQGPFKDFSFVDDHGNFKEFAQKIRDLPKTKGEPQLADVPKKSVGEQANLNSNIPTTAPMVEPNLFDQIFEFLKALFG